MAGWSIATNPLANVVADLNRQFPEPIRIDDPKLAQSRISGVLILDTQGDVLQRFCRAPIGTRAAGEER